MNSNSYKMKKLILITTLSIFCFGFLSACKKANLTRDTWKIINATNLEDGTNITSDYSGDVWEYGKEGDFFENGSKKGTWAWGDGKDKLIITEVDGSVDTYNVILLKKNEMILELPAEENIELERIK